jgi:hypothetical protein
MAKYGGFVGFQDELDQNNSVQHMLVSSLWVKYSKA